MSVTSEWGLELFINLKVFLQDSLRITFIIKDVVDDNHPIKGELTMKKLILSASLATLILTTAATAFAATNPDESTAPVAPSVQAQTNDSNVIGYVYEVENNGTYRKTPLTLGEFKRIRLEQTLGIYSKSISLGQMSQGQYDEISARLKTEFANWNGKTSTISYVGMDGKTYTVPPFKQWHPGDPAVG